ncbi:unnamed protein product [Rotaria sordida]|uniref:Uncharacterized protein n=1 Tax=Rotaria sordida TaxID=392033 RepID=A0A818NBJ5_9BILA|nr:unnamed protein product [Rotaria sordida]
MGTAESSQSSEMGAIVGLNNQSLYQRQSPNVARLIRSENSPKMEYEFPISETSTTTSLHHHHHHHQHHHHGDSGTSNHSIIPENINNRHGHSPSHHSNSSNSPQQINNSDHILGNYDNITKHRKMHSNQTSNIWLTLTSCFGCRRRNSSNSSMNSLRDKVHAIRIVRASNDLTPAVFDSHYNIITLEQLRECDNTASGNINSLPNDTSDSLPSQNVDPGIPTQNGNGSVTASAQSSSSSKRDNNHRMKRKKKKRAAATTASSSKTTYSDDDDDEGSERT